MKPAHISRHNQTCNATDMCVQCCSSGLLCLSSLENFVNQNGLQALKPYGWIGSYICIELF